MANDTPKPSEQQWRKNTLEPFEAKAGLRKEKFETSSGAEVPDLSTPDEDFAYEEKLGYPGAYPFTRGVYPSMYRGRFWTMRQYAGFGTAKQTNERFRFLMERGQKGLSTAFDLPTQIGYDSDHGNSLGEVGKVGVAIDSIEDMETVFDQIPLEKVTTSMTINATAPILLALYIVTGEHQGVPPEKLGGTLQNDLLKEYIARGTYIYPPAASMRLTGDLIVYCSKHVPRFNPISISGYHIREAGSTAVQEVAFTFANAIAYVEEVLRRGVDVDSFAGRLSFFFNVHNNFLEEVAKFRAARRLWARIMKERFKAKNPKSMMLRFHSQTGGSTLTAQSPDNNIVRVTLQALAAVLGGTQSLHTNGRDEALGLPTEAAASIALATQQIIAYESGVTDTVDPLGGSYYLEQLTDQIEADAEALIARIEDLGGAVEAIEAGFQQKLIAEAAYADQIAIESGERTVIGVNKYRAEHEEPSEVLKIDEKLEEEQVERVQTLRRLRDDDVTQRALNAVSTTARTDENIMPAIIEAVKVKATLGEIADALRDVYGEASFTV